MRYKPLFYLSLLSVVLLAAASCRNEFPGYKKSDTGLYYKYYTHSGDSAKVMTGDLIMADFTLRTKDTTILSSNRDVREPFRFEVLEPRFRGDIYDAFLMMSKGDSASFLIKGDSLFIRDFEIADLPKFIDAKTMITLEVKVMDIVPKAVFEKQKKEQAMLQQQQLMERKMNEPRLIRDYLGKNNITVAPTTTGMYYIELKAGKGPKPVKGDRVVVDYTAMLLDGKVFETSNKEVAVRNNMYDSLMKYEPFSFTIGDDSTIPGWEEGILMMRKGGKARLLVPSSLAYGEEGQPGFIEPYSPLIYEVELLEIK